jgi:hypothetical protein
MEPGGYSYNCHLGIRRMGLHIEWFHEDSSGASITYEGTGNERWTLDVSAVAMMPKGAAEDDAMRSKFIEDCVFSPKPK